MYIHGCILIERFATFHYIYNVLQFFTIIIIILQRWYTNREKNEYDLAYPKPGNMRSVSFSTNTHHFFQINIVENQWKNGTCIYIHKKIKFTSFLFFFFGFFCF